MEKYLFNDGTNVIREVQSAAELDSLIQSAPDRNKIRIWVFNTSEWLSYAAFTKITVAPVASQPVMTSVKKKPVATHPPAPRKYSWLKKVLIAASVAVVILLVYNFTKLKWVKVPPLAVSAARPANVPPVNADSLILAIESARGQKLDKITRTNLRIRNTWPERILLQLGASRDSSSLGTRFYQVHLSLDNATGYQIDEAIAEISVWKDGEMAAKDTFSFNNISYVTPAKKAIDKEYRGDSLSVSFRLIKARSFNFCYADDKQSNYGNLNDRWFCR